MNERNNELPLHELEEDSVSTRTELSLNRHGKVSQKAPMDQCSCYKISIDISAAQEIRVKFKFTSRYSYELFDGLQ